MKTPLPHFSLPGRVERTLPHFASGSRNGSDATGVSLQQQPQKAAAEGKLLEARRGGPRKIHLLEQKITASNASMDDTARGE